MNDLNRREFLTTLGASAGTASAMQPAARRRPNIPFILCDNLNPNVLGCAGHAMVKTPNIDRLASQGTYFTNCYCGSPVCVPARAGLISGMFPSDVDSYCNATPFQGQRPTWGHALRSAGYYTKATGKMDLTAKTELGFDQQLTAHAHDTGGGDLTALFRRPLCYRVNEREDIEGRVLRREHQDHPVLNTALEFLRGDVPKGSQPWLLYVGYVGPLPGFQVDPRTRSCIRRRRCLSRKFRPDISRRFPSLGRRRAIISGSRRRFPRTACAARFPHTTAM